MSDLLFQPWPWWVVGPLIGLIPSVLLVVGRRSFGLSSNFRHLCAAILPTRLDFFRYEWKRERWNLVLIAGMLVGGALAMTGVGPEGVTVDIAESTRQDLAALGLTDFSGLVPQEFFAWSALGTRGGLVLVVVGGFLVGFGARYAGGCTSGHAITGLSNLQGASLTAVIGFFAGGLLMVHVLWPWVVGR